MHAIEQTEQPAVGDVIVVGGHYVGNERTMGEILELRGELGHERYRVRWEDGHESILYPADGEATIHHYSPHGASVALMRSLREQGISFEPLRVRCSTTHPTPLSLHHPLVSCTIIALTQRERNIPTLPSESLALTTAAG